ncbi:MAG: serine/threonine-protein kinase [Actinobacteria bacterium]|nr:serine/threonine-protein kinase [Actinomycetota bacterium]
MVLGDGAALPPVPLEPLRDSDPMDLGDFRLLGRLGAGGMGVAFLAQRGREWAVVKVVRADVAEQLGFEPRFRRELEAMRRVEGAGGVRVLASSIDAHPPWFAMEFIDGMTLSRHVAQYGPLSSRRVAEFALALALVIQGMHDAGVVHRDLKPANIMMSSVGPRIIDFGIVAITDSTQVTSTGVVVGSMGWLSPEQVRGSEVTTATDIHAWALCTLFAATGRVPFNTDGGAATIYEVLEKTPAIPRGLGEPLTGLLVAALAKEPQLRPKLEDLQYALSSQAPTQFNGENRTRVDFEYRSVDPTVFDGGRATPAPSMQNSRLSPQTGRAKSVRGRRGGLALALTMMLVGLFLGGAAFVVLAITRAPAPVGGSIVTSSSAGPMASVSESTRMPSPEPQSASKASTSTTKSTASKLDSKTPSPVVQALQCPGPQTVPVYANNPDIPPSYFTLTNPSDTCTASVTLTADLWCVWDGPGAQAVEIGRRTSTPYEVPPGEALSYITDEVFSNSAAECRDRMAGGSLQIGLDNLVARAESFYGCTDGSRNCSPSQAVVVTAENGVRPRFTVTNPSETLSAQINVTATLRCRDEFGEYIYIGRRTSTPYSVPAGDTLTYFTEEVFSNSAAECRALTGDGTLTTDADSISATVVAFAAS